MLIFVFRTAFGSRCVFKSQAHFEMKNAFAGGCLPGFQVARAAAVYHADNRLRVLGDGGTDIFAQVEAAAFAQRAGTGKVKQGLRCFHVCAVPQTMSPRNDIAVEIKEIHGQSFQPRIHNGQAG